MIGDELFTIPLEYSMTDDIRDLRPEDVLLGIKHRDGNYLEGLLRKLEIPYIYCKGLEYLGARWKDVLFQYDTLLQPEFEFSEWINQGKICTTLNLDVQSLVVREAKVSSYFTLRLPHNGGLYLMPFSSRLYNLNWKPYPINLWSLSSAQPLAWAWERGLLAGFGTRDVSKYFSHVIASKQFEGGIQRVDFKGSYPNRTLDLDV